MPNRSLGEGLRGYESDHGVGARHKTILRQDANGKLR